MRLIEIRGARANNLCNVSVSFPRAALVVFTGPSGSGKTSLAFDTLYAEGRRRYIEALSVQARATLGLGARPLVDSINGLSPAVALSQRAVPRNPRSTLGTLTELDDYLRLLFARTAIAHCLACHTPIRAFTVFEIVEQISSRPAESRVMIFAPVVRSQRGHHADRIEALRRDGFVRARVDGELVALEDPLKLDPNKPHDVDVVIDRVVVRDGVRARVADAVELALKTSDGVVGVLDAEGNQTLFSDRRICVACGASLPERTPALFSFNTPQGACGRCRGLGTEDAAADAMVVDPSHSVREGALRNISAKKLPEELARWAKELGVDLDAPWRSLPLRARDEVIHGDGDGFAGVLAMNLGTGRATTKEKNPEGDEPDEEDTAGEEFSCGECHGTRLRPEALAYSVGSATMADLGRMTLEELHGFFRTAQIQGRGGPVVDTLVDEVLARLGLMLDAGLRKLSVGRSVTAMSRGEVQRARLATQLGAAMTGMLYVLDEPTVGLHADDVAALITSLRALVEQGNSVVVVEHDIDVINAADYVVDMGPGAGTQGGRVVAHGTPHALVNDPESVTGPWLTPGRKALSARSERTKAGECVTLIGAKVGALGPVDVTFRLGTFTAVTGVSGAGKTTLIHRLIGPALDRCLREEALDGLPIERVTGVEAIARVVSLDPRPLARNRRSCPATAIGLLPLVRELYAALPEARARGFRAGRFNYNAKGGRCEACLGVGTVRVAMQFLPDVEMTCELCRGSRYEPETLAVKWKGRSIAELLSLRVDEAVEVFVAHERARELLLRLHDVGLGYLTLGQPASTLSGGEAQRIRLARELSLRRTGATVYLLDEPSAGLHPRDVSQLAELLDRLVSLGDTVLVAEHDLALIASVDAVIDLDVSPGARHPRALTAVPPEALALVDCPSGRALAKYMSAECARRVG